MLNQNQKLAAETLQSGQLQAPQPNLKNKQGLTMNIKINQANSNKKIYATFLMTKNNKKKELGLNGQNAKTLLTLLKNKNNGISTFEGFGFGLPRLSGYICVLRHEYHINIITIREEHISGWHGRYVLVDAIEIGKVFNSKTQGGF